MEQQLYRQFTSNENRGIIWTLMGESGQFNGIPEEKAAFVRAAFDAKIVAVGATISAADQLVTLNKRAIIEIVQDINKYRTNANSNANATNSTQKRAEATSQTYKASELAQQRQKVFEDEFKQKQHEFEKFNAPPVPDKIDFTDKNLDTPMGSEMDKILAEQIALREKQLNMVLSEQRGGTAPPTPLFVGNNTPPFVGNSVPYEPPKLKIGDAITINISETAVPLRKKVNFIEEVSTLAPVPLDNFMSLLKKTPQVEAQAHAQAQAQAQAQTHVKAPTDNEINTIKEMLQEILHSQKKIMEMLNGAKAL